MLRLFLFLRTYRISLLFYFSFLFMTHFVYLTIRHPYVILLRIRHRLLSLRHSFVIASSSLRHSFVIASSLLT